MKVMCNLHVTLGSRVGKCMVVHVVHQQKLDQQCF
jgi:hypothetical protein